MSVLIRTVVDDDLAAIGALHRRSRRAAYAGLVSAAALAAGSDEAMAEWWTERWRWERDTHRLAVAEVARAVAGFSYVGPSETSGAVELYAIHVDPAQVGTGIGRALMISALQDLAEVAAAPDAQSPAADRAVLWVLTGNATARRFYANGGWVADGGRREAPIGPELVTQLRYARPLPFSPR
ncbi:MAG TPA: GNAT family N-acetyltransferase [Pilimelia sp.]|nr:GNAT family N-acetyltransferase [Pilimelia sp.]